MCDEVQQPLSPNDNSAPAFTSFANPNYFLNRPCSLTNDNNNDQRVVNGNCLSLEKLSLMADLESPNGAFSDYSSCDQTPTTPDRSLVLHKLKSPTDEYDDLKDDDLRDETDSDEDNKQLIDQKEESSKVQEAKMYYGIGSLKQKKSKGILEYLAMLEKQASDRENMGAYNSDDENSKEQDEKDDDDNDETDSPKVSQGGDDPMEIPKIEQFKHCTEINSPDSNDSGIQGTDKAISPDTPSEHIPEQMEESTTEMPTEEVLPEGWQKHEDSDGPYYWHVKSGTIQRDPPDPAPPDGPSLCSPRAVSLASDNGSTASSSIPSTPTSVCSGTDNHLADFENNSLQFATKTFLSMNVTQDNKTRPSQDNSSDKAVRFAVRSLGWVGIAEEELSPERSSKAVNRCIMDLSQESRNDNDPVGKWGDGKDLVMELDNHSMRLVNPEDGTVLNSQPIHSLRVWGVGRENGRERDFAYVARDRGTRVHMCHVFHCEEPARQIANTLRDICKKIMLERSLQQNAVARLARPTDLPNLDKIGHGHSVGEKLSFQNLYNNARFPTPMEEPRKVLRCHYLGVHEVMRPTGKDILNEAIQYMYYRIPPEKWKFVNVAIAPSTITITEHGNPDGIIDECRVRFLSFMGIAADNVKLCAYIMHTSQNKFLCHVFHCEPSAGSMCKTIEAACKLRYQKCMDAHPETPKNNMQGKSGKKSIRSSIKESIQCMWGSVSQLTSPK